jgi:hexosaminidase
MTPWPKPRSVANGTSALRFSAVKLSSNSSSPLLERAIARYVTSVFPASAPTPLDQSGGAAIAAISLVLRVGSDAEELSDTTDETYSLNVAADGSATADASTVFGALRALESFAQLVETANDGVLMQMRGLPWAISDAPRFGHRGILLDTGRHFLPLSAIERHIDAMAAVKLNLLHWHLVDFQSFPVQSVAAPLLGNGAWSPHETYSLADLSHIVAFAKDRGVRVMPEVDTPGHSYSWGVGYPEILTSCPTITAAANGANQVALDPTVNKTYEVVEALLAELGGIFTDNAFHLGGDEVRYACWNASEHVRDYMRAKGYGLDFARLEAEYENELLAIAARALPERTVMVYQEVFDNNITLPERVVFGVWKMGGSVGNTASIPEEVTKIVKAGHKVVVANGNNGEWYLNHGFGSGNTVSLWPAVYALDPLNGTTLSAAEAALVIGGEASLWGEEIDEHNLEPKAWPRGAAFAERMWSDRDVKDVGEAGPRLARMFCRLTARGFRASPVSPGSCFKTAQCLPDTPGCASE